jgi:tetratricopeptide (TPR) repeat protein
MSEIGDGLRESLLALDLDGLSSGQITVDITSEVGRVLVRSGSGKVFRELSTGRKVQPPSAAAPRMGYVDFAIVRGGEVAVVVEIDRSDKRFSLTKLEYFRDRGAQAIWIRWGRPTQLTVPDGIELIEIPIAKGAKARRPLAILDKAAPPPTTVGADLFVTVLLRAPRWARNAETGEPLLAAEHTCLASATQSRGEVTAFLDHAGAVAMDFATDDILETTWQVPRARSGAPAPNVIPSRPSWLTKPEQSRVPSHLRHQLELNPRAYQPWTDAEDVALLEGRRAGLSVEKLAKLHQRQVGAIRSRLAKLEEPDPLTASENAKLPAPMAKVPNDDIFDGAEPPDDARDSRRVNPEDRLDTLVFECDGAWTARDWELLRRRSLSALFMIRYGVVPEPVIVLLSRRYLGSLLRTGDMIGHPDSPERDIIVGEVSEFATWVDSLPELPPLLAEYVTAATLVLELSVDDSIVALGQLASRLRALTRPDLALRVTDGILRRSRLNYYAQATRGAALCDLGDYDAAIDSLKAALAPYRPQDGVERVLNALSRAFRLRFEQSGDMDDCELAILCGKAAWGLKPDNFAANTYLAAAAKAPDPIERKQADEAITDTRRDTPPDRSALDELLERLSLRST